MSNQVSTPLPGSAESPPDGRLDSWKEISAYLKREVRTVQRWEKSSGLPVHRLQIEKQGTVYAYKTELDAWYRNRRPELESDTANPNARPISDNRRISSWAAAVAAVIIALLSGGGVSCSEQLVLPHPFRPAQNQARCPAFRGPQRRPRAEILQRWPDR